MTDSNSVNEVYDGFFMMDVELEEGRFQNETLYFNINDVVGWKSVTTLDPDTFYIIIMFHGGHQVRTRHEKNDFEDIMKELEDVKCSWVKGERQIRKANNDTH
ncbi:hypothetical protein [uncultured Mediterranean phage uvMED]|nr:hypothetical protein [uncultured Mediterranean phage uvMED]BAR19158.1 hypothetical protein [uncultured Mediterranean phage uvMED]